MKLTSVECYYTLLTDDESALVQVIAWCCLATSQCLKQSLPISINSVSVGFNELIAHIWWSNGHDNILLFSTTEYGCILYSSSSKAWFWTFTESYHLPKLTTVMMTPSNGKIFRITGPLCRELTGHGWIPAQRLVTQSFDVFFDLRLNKWLSKQWWGWWFETSSCLLWRHCNGRATVVAIPHNGLDSCVLLLCISVWCTQRNIRGDERNKSNVSWYHKQNTESLCRIYSWIPTNICMYA